MTRYTNKSNVTYQERYLSVPSMKPVQNVVRRSEKLAESIRHYARER